VVDGTVLVSLTNGQSLRLEAGAEADVAAGQISRRAIS
jgi:hypothetical protein